MKKLLLSLIVIAGITEQTQAQIITTVTGNGFGAGLGGGGYSGDGGQATAAEMQEPLAVAFDAAGNYYICANESMIRKVNTAGIISTFSGGIGLGYTGDGGQASAATLNYITGLTVDASNNLYIADQGNNAIRKIVLSTGIITTIAGNNTGVEGYSGDGGQATNAKLNSPNTVTFDALGNMYIADGGNNLIRKVNTAGIITTIAGDTTGANIGSNNGYSGDGGVATSAEFYNPYGVVCDAMGNLFVSDQGNNCIRVVNSLGIINTIAGTGISGFGGDGGAATAAQLSGPQGLVLDAAENLYVADFENARIRKVNSLGIITTYAGNGTHSYSGDGGIATAAALSDPYAIAFDATANMYIADAYNNVIRKVCNTSCAAAGIEPFANNKEKLNIYPNPNNGSFVIEPNSSTKQSMQVYDVNGKLVLSQMINGKTNIDAGSLNEGVYTISLISNNGVVNNKLVIVR